MILHSFYLASRPKTLIASISPICLGTSLAIGHKSFDFLIFLCTLITGLGIQILTNLINDLFDFSRGADTQHRKGPTRVMVSGLMSAREMVWSLFLVMIATSLFGTLLAFRGGLLIVCLLPLSFLFAYSYTAGPFPFAYLGIAEFFVLIFFGPVATGLTYFLQTSVFNLQAFALGITPGLLSCSILILNNLRDMDEDRKAQKKTLVVRFGTHFGKWEYAAALIIGFLLPFATYGQHPLYLLSTALLLPSLLLIRSVLENTDPYAYNSLFSKTGKLLFYYTLIGSLSLAI